MSMQWTDITREDYNRVRKEANWEGSPPNAQTRQMPAVRKLGIIGEPRVQLHDAYATFAPNP
jgi:hypothetical protein